MRGKRQIYACIFMDKWRFNCWITLVINCMIVGKKEHAKEAMNQMKQISECDTVGGVKEYVGYKVKRDSETKSLKLAQTVMLQSFQNKFDFGLKINLTRTPV